MKPAPKTRVKYVKAAFSVRASAGAIFHVPLEMEVEWAALPGRFVDEQFAFGKLLSGAKELRPRWQRCVRQTTGELPDAVRAVVQCLQ